MIKNYLSLRASRSDSMRQRISSSRTGPLTFLTIDRDWSSMNSTRTWVTPPREPVRPRTLMTLANLTGVLVSYRKTVSNQRKKTLREGKIFKSQIEDQMSLEREMLKRIQKSRGSSQLVDLIMALNSHIRSLWMSKIPKNDNNERIKNKIKASS